MQGRLSPQIDGRIQAFPWPFWEDEFPVAGDAQFELLEWTLDADRLHENPLLLPSGQERIRQLTKVFRVEVLSLTGDCFMQAPFWKASGAERQLLLRDFKDVLSACAAICVRYVVVPLVDNGRLGDASDFESLRDGLVPHTQWLLEHNIEVLFESDLPPENLAAFMTAFPQPSFGINYDIGNSAALGFDPAAEIRAYGHRIRNVHVKDRVFGGTTVPLGCGAADFPRVFRELARASYGGDFILQTARAADGRHLDALIRYRDMVRGWIAASGI